MFELTITFLKLLSEKISYAQKSTNIKSLPREFLGLYLIKYKYFSTAYYLPFLTILNNANIQSTKIKTFPITKINKTTIGIITIIETIDFILLLKSGK